MKLVHIQQALFAAYDIRNAMTNADMRRPTEGESMGECLTEVIEFLEVLEKQNEEETEHYSKIFCTIHGDLK
jgi:hypothetical protein